MEVLKNPFQKSNWHKYDCNTYSWYSLLGFEAIRALPSLQHLALFNCTDQNEWDDVSWLQRLKLQSLRIESSKERVSILLDAYQNAESLTNLRLFCVSLTQEIRDVLETLKGRLRFLTLLSQNSDALLNVEIFTNLKNCR